MTQELLKKAGNELVEYGWASDGVSMQAELDRFLASAESMLAARLVGEEAS